MSGEAISALLGLGLLATSAHASNLVVNGNFEQLREPGVAAEFGSRYASQQLVGWTSTGYNIVFTPGSADTSGAIGEWGPVSLWGPNNGSNYGLPASSQACGNFIAMDGDFAVGPVSQTLQVLIPEKSVTVSFFWGGAQQYGFNGATTEQLEVSLGNENQYTPIVDNASHGFTGWQKESMTFTATSSSEVLSFLAIGTPTGVPPFSLLDGVTASTAAPEPATWALFGASLAGLGGLRCLRRRSAGTTKSTDNE